MSRTPKYNIDTLPKWVQNIITNQNTLIDVLQTELETAYGWVNNLEDTLEELSKQNDDQCEGDCGQPESSGITTYHG